MICGRYVLHRHVLAYLHCGWMLARRPVVNDIAVLMLWVCGCKCVEPITNG